MEKQHDLQKCGNDTIESTHRANVYRTNKVFWKEDITLWITTNNKLK